MAGTNEQLRRLGVEYVAANQPCRPNDLVRWLRKQCGASTRAANETLLTLLRDGYLRRTFTGKLTT
jgi:hypothetical protein